MAFRVVRVGVGLGVAGAVTGVAANQWRKQRLYAGAPTLSLFPQPVGDASGRGGEEQRRRAVVIGAGVVGVCTAFDLAQRGYSVAVLDAASSPSATPSSDCAAGGMQRSSGRVDAAKWRAVLSSLFPTLASIVAPPGPSFRFFDLSATKALTDPHFVRWVLQFTRCSLWPSEEAEQRAAAMLRFTDFAIARLVERIEDRCFAQAVGFNATGAVSLDYDGPPGPTTAPRPLGPGALEPVREVTQEELFELEPCLRHRRERVPTHGRLEYEAKSGNSELFTREMAAACRGLGVVFVEGAAVLDMAPSLDGTHVERLCTERGVVEVDPETEVVVCAGAWSPKILATAGLYAAIYPLKGYCIPLSVPATPTGETPPDAAPTRIVHDKYVFTSRLGEQVRVTSIGEFSGWDTTPTPSVDARFRAEAKLQLPLLATAMDATPTRVGMRPYSADGAVLLGRITGFCNLSINCGPGSNGWKNSVGAAHLLAAALDGDSPGGADGGQGVLEPGDVSLISPAGRVRRSQLFAALTCLRWFGL